ncbi:unnamed protein product [Triticum turgidum subsp. durum]|uniref:DNA/RNA-binding protein Alba-like domain-containing protein n=2 Tax=Triticum TaxID=4564 RepID=A0A8R7UW08_TRIUA|nr:unnamed protein product [Triticum turgidum subsp. durum]
MEEVTEAVNNLTIGEGAAATAGAEGHKKNRIQVSNTKKPLFFYVNLAKRYMQLHEEVELSALGMGKSSLAEAYFCISLGLCYVTLAMICRMHRRI